jgi:glycogen operon protein
MQAEDWSSGFGKAIGVFFNGETIPSPDARGERVVDDSFLVLFNAHHEPISFTMPAIGWGARWLRMLDTADAFNEGEGVDAATATTVDARSLALFRRTS